MSETKEIKTGQKEYLSYVQEIKQENEMMKKEIKELKLRIEQLEKGKKKNNIIMTGYETEEQREPARKNELQEFMKQKLNVNAIIKSVKKIGKEKHIIEMDSWKGKMDVLRNKNKLRHFKNKIIYINEDLTREEREIRIN
ncbi:hypothetical protein QE152_g9249 [Popillia japonica]|uniref:Uncharacterized protein n=1 Tax=Popillia japonica TaxID=7064 RepID=A0AAW1M058_POPJA